MVEYIWQRKRKVKCKVGTGVRTPGHCLEGLVMLNHYTIPTDVGEMDLKWYMSGRLKSRGKREKPVCEM